MIRTIQGEAHEAVQSMEQAGRDVTAAVKLTDQTGAAFHDIAKSSQGMVSRLLSLRETAEAMRKADEQVEEATGEVAAIAENNRQAAEAMAQLNNQMVASLDAVSAVVEENTASTEEMAAGATEVAQAIENIASVSEENSAAVEEVSASAEEMSAQVEEVTASAQSLADMAETLRQVVAQFRLSAADATHAEREVSLAVSSAATVHPARPPATGAGRPGADRNNGHRTGESLATTHRAS